MATDEWPSGGAAPRDARPFWKRRRYHLPLVIGALANLGVYLGLTYRLATKQDRLARELAALGETVAAQRAELETLKTEADRLAGNEAATARFWTDVLGPRQGGLRETVAEIDRLAREAGVQRGRTSYGETDHDVGVVEIKASMPLRGDYFDLVKFLNQLERSSRFFLIREVGLERLPEGAELELRCNVSFFFRPDAGGAPAGE
jgi:Tfp pilus assembly protein PilO